MLLPGILAGRALSESAVGTTGTLKVPTPTPKVRALSKSPTEANAPLPHPIVGPNEMARRARRNVPRAIVSSVGIVLAIVYITPPGMNPRDVYIPFGWMIGLTAAYALFWTLCVQKVNPFKPVPVEQVLENAFAKGENEEAQFDRLTSLT